MGHERVEQRDAPVPLGQAAQLERDVLGTASRSISCGPSSGSGSGSGRSPRFHSSAPIEMRTGFGYLRAATRPLTSFAASASVKELPTKLSTGGAPAWVSDAPIAAMALSRYFVICAAKPLEPSAGSLMGVKPMIAGASACTPSSITISACACSHSPLPMST